MKCYDCSTGEATAGREGFIRPPYKEPLCGDCRRNRVELDAEEPPTENRVKTQAEKIAEALLNEAKGKTLGPNQFVHYDSEGNEVFYSYNTPVAAVIKGKAYKTSKKWSATTSRHISNYLNDLATQAGGGSGLEDAEEKAQEFFDAL